MLNEENYQKGVKKLKLISLVVLIIGLLIGGSLIATGLSKKSEINSQYSEESKATLSEQIETEKQKLINEKAQLEAKIKPTEDEIKSLEREPFTGFDDAYYARKDRIEELEKSIESDKNSIEVINDALDETFSHCSFGETKNNSYTSKYCDLKNQLGEITDFNKDFDSFETIPYYMIGGFIILASCMIAGSIFMFAKKRDIAAFSMQQTMPLAQEGIEKMSPTVGKAAGTIGKEIAKGISEGIKEGKGDE